MITLLLASKEASQDIGWFEITKDIIIPSLTLISTITIGIFIALILKNREEKEKRKNILIDTYIEYLNTRVNELENHINNIYKNILNDLLINGEQIVGINSNWHNKYSLIKEKLEAEELIEYNKADNWSFFTYKFCFLLGTKKYRKSLQLLEDSIVNNLLDNKKNEKFYIQLSQDIFSKEEIKNGILSSNQNIVKFTLDKIKEIIAVEFNKRHRLFFEPYDSKVADLIDEL